MAVGGRPRDWFQWHEPYDDAQSPLHARLRAVQRLIADALDRCRPGPVSVISICAGQGRDLLGVLSDHPRGVDVCARLVELDPRNADAARAAGVPGVEVVTGDASSTTAYDGVVPADLVLACGVFGNVSDDDVRHTIRRLPMLCAVAGTVIWTRGGFDPDLRPAIRRWFTQAGFEEVAFETGENPSGDWGVGANRLVGPAQRFEPDVRLFTFLDST